MKHVSRRRAVIVATAITLVLAGCQTGGGYASPGPRFASDDGHR